MRLLRCIKPGLPALFFDSALGMGVEPPFAANYVRNVDMDKLGEEMKAFAEKFPPETHPEKYFVCDSLVDGFDPAALELPIGPLKIPIEMSVDVGNPWDPPYISESEPELTVSDWLARYGINTAISKESQDGP